MDDFISTSVEEACGVIRLTRPAAINALTPDMIAEVLDALHDWADEERIGAVLIEGEGERGLCAGAMCASLARASCRGNSGVSIRSSPKNTK